MTAEVEVNGTKVSSPKFLSNGNANVDGSYVFVNGNGAVSDGPVDTDLNSGSVVVVAVESEINNKQSVEEIRESLGSNQLNSEEDKIETSDVNDKQKSLVLVTESHVDRENEPVESSNKEGRSGEEEDQAIDLPQNGAELEIQLLSETLVVNAADQDATKETESLEIVETLPSPVHSADLPVKDPCENGKLDKTSEIGETVVDLEQNSEAASSPRSHVVLEKQVVSDPPSDECVQGLGTDHTQDGVPVIVNDVSDDASQEAPKPSEIAESLPTPVDSENVAVESCQTSSPAVSGSINDNSATQTDAVFGDTSVTENVPSCATDDVRIEAEIGELDTTSTSVDIEADNGSVGSDQSIIPATSVIIRDTTAQTDAVFGDSTFTENLPSCAVDLKRDTEIGNLDMGSSKSYDSHPVDGARVNTEVQNGPESLHSPVDYENVPVENGQSINPAASDIVSDTTAQTDVVFGDPTVTESLPSSAVDDVKIETEIGNLDTTSKSCDSHPVVSTNADIEIENGRVGNGTAESLPSPADFENVPLASAQSIIPAASVTISDTTAQTDIVFGDFTVTASLPSCVVADTERDTEIGNLVTTSTESYDSHPVVSTIVDTEVENGPVGNGSLESLPSPVDKNVPVESGQSIIPAASVIIGDTTTQTSVLFGNSTVAENLPSCAVDDVKRETEIRNMDLGSTESYESIGTTKVGIEVADGPVANDTASSFPNGDAKSETKSGLDSCETEESNMNFEVLKGVTELGECVDSQPIITYNAAAELCKSDLVVKESSLHSCAGADADVKAESGIENSSAVSCRDVSGDDGAVSESEVLNGAVISSQITVNCIPDVHIENGGIQITGEETDGKTCLDVEGADGTRREETPTSTPGGSTIDAFEVQNVGSETGKRPFYYLVKVPRYDDQNLKEQIESAKFEVNEKTGNRDAIRVKIQTTKATLEEYANNLEAAMSEERASRALLKSKRQEIDSLQSKINTVKNANSVEDIDVRIRNMEHMMAHETLPLKEEKQFIREIKQLKQLREQFCSSMGKHDEVQQALDQKDQTEERLKILRKETSSLRENVLKAEAATEAAKKKHKDEIAKLRELQAQFRAADNIRQEAYAHFQSLKKQAYDKNKNFWKYKDDVKEAYNLVLKGDREALQHLCVSQVERILQLWNSNDEFREDYIRCNTTSTVRRLKTLDGRSLGPDEEAPVVRSFVNDRMAKVISASQISTHKEEKEEKAEQAVPIESYKVDTKPVAEVPEQKNQIAKSGRPAKPARSANPSATVPIRNEMEEAREEEPKRTKEEEELARKAEELRKEKEVAKLKEQLRLEEKTKAKEALERKKRIAEKAQARAALRAQKEAEQKEKEREKRARKKEKRKGTVTEDAELTDERESASQSETPKDCEVKEKPVAVTKRSQKPSQFAKQMKTQSIPLPLRNRGKRRMQSWMWVLVAAMVVFALFLLGNSSFSYKFGLQSFGF